MYRLEYSWTWHFLEAQILGMECVLSAPVDCLFVPPPVYKMSSNSASCIGNLKNRLLEYVLCRTALANSVETSAIQNAMARLRATKFSKPYWGYYMTIYP